MGVFARVLAGLTKTIQVGAGLCAALRDAGLNGRCAAGAVPPGPPKSLRYQSAGVDIAPRTSAVSMLAISCACHM
jgi:hypothetical protein